MHQPFSSLRLCTQILGYDYRACALICNHAFYPAFPHLGPLSASTRAQLASIAGSAGCAGGVPIKGGSGGVLRFISRILYLLRPSVSPSWEKLAGSKIKRWRGLEDFLEWETISE